MLNVFCDTPAAERIIVALDGNRNDTLALAEELQGKARWVKIGMTLYYECGPSIVSAFKQRGFKVFLDLKFHDIPFQVEGAAKAAALTGADMLTMHCLGGEAMLKAAQRGVDAAAAERQGSKAITLGITVLTSMNEADLNQVGINAAPAEEVSRLANVAKAAAIDGVVASAQEASMLREILGPKAYIVTPGIRPAGSNTDDQSRVATPKEAFDLGASHVVIGRPITKSGNPAAAFAAIVEEL